MARLLLIALIAGVNPALCAPDPHQPASEETRFNLHADLACSVSRPANWHPSGIRYANAFELLNYPPDDPGAVAERNRARLIFTHTLNETAEATERFLAGITATTDRGLLEIRTTSQGHRALRVRAMVPFRQLGPGAAPSQTSPGSSGPPGSSVSISLYVGVGRHLISAQGTLSPAGDPSVLQELDSILDGLKLNVNTSPGEAKKKGGNP